MAIAASAIVAGRAPAEKTTGFAASWPWRGHEVSILMAGRVRLDGFAASSRAGRSR